MELVSKADELLNKRETTRTQFRTEVVNRLAELAADIEVKKLLTPPDWKLDENEFRRMFKVIYDYGNYPAFGDKPNGTLNAIRGIEEKFKRDPQFVTYRMFHTVYEAAVEAMAHCGQTVLANGKEIGSSELCH
jgi:hypothetical protein